MTGIPTLTAPVKTGRVLWMKVLYVEGLASYGGPESCVHIREGVGEALTGVRVGRVLSREIHAPGLRSRVVRGAEAVETCRRPHHVCRNGEAGMDPARSQTPCTHGRTLQGNREIPSSSAARCEASQAERIEKPMGVQR